jgi:hypothetical protein
MSAAEVPSLDGGIQRASYDLFLRIAEFGRSDEVLMRCERMLWSDCASQGIQSCLVISGTRHQMFVV